MRNFDKKININKKGFTRTPKFGVTPKGSGFTLVETLVAVSIFSVSILGLMSILTNGISNTDYAKRKIIATYLAQEGVEYIRNMRDTYTLYDPTSSQNGWDLFVTKLNTATCQNANGCYFDDNNLDYDSDDRPMALGLVLTACGASCPNLLYDSTGKYGYTLGSNSIYIRKINVSSLSADELKVTSTVSWTQGSGTYQAVFSESLFNWIE